MDNNAICILYKRRKDVMTCCNKDRFINQQTYINTICQTRPQKCNQKPPLPPSYCQYTICTPTTKFSVHSDCLGTQFSFSVDINTRKNR